MEGSGRKAGRERGRDVVMAKKKGRKEYKKGEEGQQDIVVM